VISIKFNSEIEWKSKFKKNVVVYQTFPSLEKKN
jgi:hypothetical protein